MAIESINPATGRKIKSYTEHTPGDIRTFLERAEKCYQAWRRTNFKERAGKMREAARCLRTSSKEGAKLMALEMGKPVRQGMSEIEKCAWVCDYYAEHAEKFLAPETAETDASKSYTAFEPIGLVLAVMPWNFPFWQVLRAAAPTLMAGNGFVLKHASNVPGCALAIDTIFRKAGFPNGLFCNLLIPGSRVAEVIDNTLIQAVTLTGSTPAGKAVASRAGQMFKKTVLELGGSDPYLILEDADLEAAAIACAASRMVNGGQSCIAAKRFIVVEPVRKSFESLLTKAMSAQTIGDPMDESVTLGPMARRDLRDALHEQVTKSIAQGAGLRIGGKIPERPGAYYPPTILTNVKKGMPAYDEELFGPVAAVIGVKNEADAIHTANDTVFGLGAAVFTKNKNRGEKIAREDLEAGACFVNTFVKSDPRLPFGGIKTSGYGRELGLFGIREFVNIKTVYVK